MDAQAGRLRVQGPVRRSWLTASLKSGVGFERKQSPYYPFRLNENLALGLILKQA